METCVVSCSLKLPPTPVLFVFATSPFTHIPISRALIQNEGVVGIGDLVFPLTTARHPSPDFVRILLPLRLRYPPADEQPEK
jgi:hypothetical protein